MPVPEGDDPDGECTGEAECSGTCDGLGACHFPDDAQVCGAAYCHETDNLQYEPRCNGIGGCEEVETDCGYFDCDAVLGEHGFEIVKRAALAPGVGRVGHLDEAGVGGRADPALAPGDSAGHLRAARAAVERVLEGDDDRLLRAAGLHAPGAGELDRVLGRLGAGREDEALRERRGRLLDEPLGELGAKLVRKTIIVKERPVDHILQLVPGHYPDDCFLQFHGLLR